ncbi:putative transporter [Paramagnetospirillum magnetotacticum MS-1]|uniref:Putative transporter n=1 Tax=Paramagnetospirillum magnetotacticum MS-1 TaxID=272627 RepID=A0A0C2V5T2_PARME|nr:MFS transporter [Paramagnetospirillum magnetotacticum]KIM00427.1 putative transporter [Paramagnetospirillum magnetotacticum MS-1]
MSLDRLEIPMPDILPTERPEKTMTRPAAGHSPLAILICASAILAISLGVRHSFGLFLQPVTEAGGWSREAFGFAIALQNLVWGLSQPFAGLLADRIGAGRMIIVGTALYVVGLLVMALPQGETAFILGTGLLVGLGLSGTTYPLVLGAVTRATSPEKRSLALGLAMGGAAFGQFVMLPGALSGIGVLGWSGALVAMAVLSLVMAPLAVSLMENGHAPSQGAEMSAGQAIRQALRHRGFQLLALGFFVCGFQVVFIATHVPAFLSDKGLTAGIGSTVLALIGLLNIPGTYYAGLWGTKWRKPMLLSWLYLARAGIIAGFAFLPVSEWSAYAFGAAMGLVWLSTVPLTNGTVAALFGVRNMSMLGGVVFLAHQLGAFLGGWLGGVLYDRLGSYDGAWMVAIGLSLLAALLNLPIREEAAEPAKAAA